MPRKPAKSILKKSFIQIIVQEKSTDDYRAFCICSDGEGWIYELRSGGHGTPQEAVEIVFGYYQLSIHLWEIYGECWAEKTYWKKGKKHARKAS